MINMVYNTYPKHVCMQDGLISVIVNSVPKVIFIINLNF